MFARGLGSAAVGDIKSKYHSRYSARVRIFFETTSQREHRGLVHRVGIQKAGLS